MKSLLFTLVLLWGLGTVAAPEQKLLYCDHMAGSQKIYLDIYLSYYPNQQVFADPQVGVYDPQDPSFYPSYLWPLSLVYDPSSLQTLLTIDRGIGNEMRFILPAMDSGFVLNTFNGDVIPFNLRVEGFYKGQEVETLLSCYNVFIP